MKAKRVVSGILAVASAVSCASLMTACQTDRPKVQMEIVFQEQSYTLNYTLYRKVAPATVEHFLTLAENGYYDNVIVHDYADSRMYTGAYTYGDASVNEGLLYKNYYDIVKTYKYFPVSVYTQGKNSALFNLIGEFADNDIEVKNGEKKESLGSLTMYYTDKKAETYTVTVKHPEGGEDNRDYRYNSATSMFFISLTDSEKTNTNYCTFATLSDNSVQTFTDMKTAIAEYLDAEHLAQVTLKVDEDDPFVGGTNKTVTYDVPESPITIKKVTVKSR